MRIGIVVSIRGDRAVVDARSRGPCGSCREGDHCGLHLGLAEDRPQRIVAHNPIGAKPGDVVELALVGHTELRLSLAIWILPLLGLLAGAVLGAVCSPRFGLDADLGTLGGAITGCGLIFVVLSRIDRRLTGHHQLTPVIARLCPSPDRFQGS